MTRYLALAAALFLAACNKPEPPEPIIQTVEVQVPVPFPCVPKGLDAAPAYPDTDEALRKATDAAERYMLLYAGRMLRDARLGELEPVVRSCPREK